ncbi:MAG: dihydroneopterin aldolase [Crocinitomicaceae bacterium]|nr:dihydroneopterin aldolase [Crocinitomicaceae bacterium]
MKHTIEVNGIKVYAFHGCLPEEGKIGGYYVVDVHLTTDFSLAAEQDDLSHTIDYVIVNQIVEQEMAIKSKLIEHVGQRIIMKLRKSLDTIENVRVKVTKISPPINGDVDNVAIIIQD